LRCGTALPEIINDSRALIVPMIFDAAGQVWDAGHGIVARSLCLSWHWVN
jgi:hypothetical protein